MRHNLVSSAFHSILREGSPVSGPSCCLNGKEGFSVHSWSFQ